MVASIGLVGTREDSDVYCVVPVGLGLGTVVGCVGTRVGCGVYDVGLIGFGVGSRVGCHGYDV